MFERPKDWDRVRGSDKVSGVELSGVPGSEPGSGEAEDSVRMLDGEGFLAHYAHLREARARDPDHGACCQRPPESLVVDVPGSVSRDPVVPGPGDDEKEASALPQRGGRAT